MVVLMRLMIGTASVAARAHRTKPPHFHGTVSLQSPCASSRALRHHSPSLDPFRHRTALSSSFPNPRSAPTPPPRAMPDRPSPGGGPGTGPPGGGRGTGPPGGGRGTDPPGGGRGTVPPGGGRGTDGGRGSDGGRGTDGGRGSDGGRGTGGALGKDTGEEDHIPKDPKFWGNLLVFFQGLSSPVVDKLKAVLATSNSNESAVPLELPRLTDNCPASGTMESDDLPRFSVYLNTFHGPPMTPIQEAKLKNDLVNVLKQLQNTVKVLGLQPVELEIAQPFPISTSPGDYPSPVKRSGIEYLRSPMSSARRTEVLLREKEKQTSEILEVYEQFSSKFKLSIATGIESKHINPQFAQELQLLVQCCDANMKKVLQSGEHFFSLSRLLDKLSLPDKSTEWLSDAKAYLLALQHGATFAGWAISAIGTTHGYFNAIGKRTERILDTDYTFDNLKLNSDPFNNLSFGLGAQVGGEQSVRLLLGKWKYKQFALSFSLKSLGDVANAVNANGVNGVNVADSGNVNAVNVNPDISSIKVLVNKPWGADLKCALDIPYPSFNGKFEIRGSFPYVSCSGGIELMRNPRGAGLPPIRVFDLSALLGMKYYGIGGQLQFSQGQMRPTLGMSVRTKLLAVGLKCKRTGNCSLTFVKEICSRCITVAGKASYIPDPGQDQHILAPGENPGFRYALGWKHVIDPTLYYKARVGSDGASVLIKKSNSTGMFSVKAAAHVDFHQPWNVPKIGIVTSFRW